jgi:hypothetical protein
MSVALSQIKLVPGPTENPNPGSNETGAKTIHPPENDPSKRVHRRVWILNAFGRDIILRQNRQPIKDDKQKNVPDSAWYIRATVDPRTNHDAYT